MNKKGITYDNSLRYSQNDPRKPDTNAGRTKKQTSGSLHRTAEMTDRYRAQQQPKVLMHGLASAGAARHSPQRGGNSENRPAWNDKVASQKNPYKDRLDARAIRSDYGKDQPTPANNNVDATQQMLALQNKDSLQQLREMVKNDKIIKTNEISKKSGLEMKELQDAMVREEKIKKSYDNFLVQKYEKIEEQKNLNAFLEGQIRVIRSHRKDVSKAKALEGPTQKSLAKERQSRERDVLNSTWNDQLEEMKQQAEAKQAKATYTRDYLRKEQEEAEANAAAAAAEAAEAAAAERLEQPPRREDMPAPPYLTSRALSPQMRRLQDQLLSDQGPQIERKPDAFLEISKQEAWKQYDISKSIKTNRQEKLVDRANYLHIEKALGTMEARLDPYMEEEKLMVQNAAFSGNLIGRATTKLIKVHHEKIIELLVDELCLEMVAILSKEDAEKSEECEKMTRECLVNDYLDEFREMAYEQSDIVDRMKQTKAIRSINHEPFTMNMRQTQPHEIDAFYNNPDELQIQYAQIELSMGVLVNILEKKSEFSRYINRLDHYQKKNLQSFSLILEAILDDIVLSVTNELDNANDHYAELMFQHEFK